MKPFFITIALLILLPLSGCTADQLAGPITSAGEPSARSNSLDTFASASLDGRWMAADTNGALELKLSDGPEAGEDGHFRGEAVLRVPNARHRLLSVTAGKISGDRMTLRLLDARGRRFAIATGHIKEDFSTFRLRFEFEHARARVLTFERL